VQCRLPDCPHTWPPARQPSMHPVAGRPARPPKAFPISHAAIPRARRPASPHTGSITDDNRWRWADTFASRGTLTVRNAFTHSYVTMCQHMSLKVPIPNGDLDAHLIYGLLGSHSVQSFQHSSLMYPTHTVKASYSRIKSRDKTKSNTTNTSMHP